MLKHFDDKRRWFCHILQIGSPTSSLRVNFSLYVKVWNCLELWVPIFLSFSDLGPKMVSMIPASFSNFDHWYLWKLNSIRVLRTFMVETIKMSLSGAPGFSCFHFNTLVRVELNIHMYILTYRGLALIFLHFRSILSIWYCANSFNLEYSSSRVFNAIC